MISKERLRLMENMTFVDARPAAPERVDEAKVPAGTPVDGGEVDAQQGTFEEKRA